MTLRSLRYLLIVCFGLVVIGLLSQRAEAQEITYYTFDNAPGTFSYSCQDQTPNPPLCFNDGTGSGGSNPSLVQDTFPSNLNPGGDGSGVHTALRLNQAQGSQFESAWFSVPQKISNGFTSYFAFKISQGSTPPADGFAFVVQNADGNRPADPDSLCSEIGSGPTVVGGSGGCLGYSGIDDSLAVEFDTFTNGYDPIGDVNGGGNHIAVQSCGSGVNSSSHLETGCLLGINNALSESLSDGLFHEVVVEYSGASGTPANLLQVYLDPVFIPGTHTPIEGTVPVVSVTYDMQHSIGLLNGDSAYVGFTGATGALFQNQEIAAWTFTPHTPVSQQETLQPAGDTTPFPFGAHTYGVTYPPDAPDPSVDMIVTANTISPVLFDTLIATAPPPLNTTHCQIFDSTGGNCVIYSITCVATGTTTPPVDCPSTADPTIVVKTAFESFNGVDPLDPGFVQGDPFYTAITQVTGTGSHATATCGGKCGVTATQTVTILNNSLTGPSATVIATSVTIDTFTFDSAASGTGTGGFVTSTNVSDIFSSYTPQKIDGTTSGKTKNFSDFAATGIEPIAFLSANSTQGFAGYLLNFTVSASGYPAPTLTETSGGLPAGFTFVNGVLSGTPNEGVYHLTFHAQNSTIAPAQNQTFTLTIGPPIAFTSGTSATFPVGTASTFPVTATGTPTPTISTTSSLPSGVFFDGTALSGTPATGTEGTYPITFKASNGVAPDMIQSFTLTVGVQDSSPVFTSAPSTAFIAGTAGLFNVTASGSPAPTFSTTATLPSGVSLSPAGALSSNTAAAQGVYTFVITATNGIAPDAIQSFTLTIDKAPAFTSTASVSFVAGTPGSFGVSATGTPAPTFSTTATFPSGVALSSTGSLTSTAASPAGIYHFSITASNGVPPDAIQAFTLTISSTIAFTSAATTTFTAGTPGSFNVTASGSPAPTFRVYSGSLPSGVSLSTAGLLKSSNSAKAGTYRFVIKASNGVASDVTQAFTLVIQKPAGSISLSPSSLAFGDVYLGTKTHRAVSITNTSNQPVMITKLTLTPGTGPSRTDYGYDLECSDVLKPGQKCIVTMELHAQDIGSGTSTLNIFFNGPTAQVALSGNVINPKARLSTSSLSFGSVKVGSSSSKTVTLTNNGDTTLAISSIALSGSTDFTRTTTCTSTLEKNLSCNISVKFAPTAKQSRMSKLTITDNATPTTTQTVNLTGTGN